MNKIQILAFMLLFILALPTPLLCATTLPKPTITMPSGWILKQEVPYPMVANYRHDTEGAGYLEYENPSNKDNVKIYYERALTTGWSQAALEAEACDVYDSYIVKTLPRLGSNITTLPAGYAGYAYGYDYEWNAHMVAYVFTAGDYYIHAEVYYDDNDQSEQTVNSLLYSIKVASSTSGGTTDNTTLFTIIGVVAFAAVAVTLAIVLMRRRNRKAVKPKSQQSTPELYPPPPPPP